MSMVYILLFHMQHGALILHFVFCMFVYYSKWKVLACSHTYELEYIVLIELLKFVHIHFTMCSEKIIYTEKVWLYKVWVHL